MVYSYQFKLTHIGEIQNLYIMLFMYGIQFIYNMLISIYGKAINNGILYKKIGYHT